MTKRMLIAVLGLGLVLGLVSGKTIRAQETPEKTVVLDSLSFWRIHHTVGTPVAEVDGKIREMEKPWRIWERSKVSEGWMKPDFDDRGWARMMVRMTACDKGLSQLYLRGKFEVTDPGKVKGLKLSVVYHGGAIVYVNGEEVTRAHVAKGSELAERYPEEVFADKNGKLTRRIGHGARLTRRKDKLQAMKRRTLEEIEIPSRLLRRGVNVVGIEVVRSPYSKTVYAYKVKGNDRKYRWATCMLIDVQLTAASGKGLTANARRPSGLQVWNQNLLASDFVVDWGDRAEPLRPVEIVGARNGSFSGKLMVGSDKEIEGLSVKVGNLKGTGGMIPGSQVKVRYAIPWGVINYRLRSRSNVGRVDDELGALVEKAPEVIPPRKSGTSRELVDGAVTVVWVTVKVPKGAKPGAYSGKITIKAKGEKSITAPLELKVLDWTLSDPQDYHVWVEIIQSPDTLAIHYETPLWSKRHWELIGQSFRLMSNSGSRVVYVPLIAETNQGNSESMVRWVKKGDGTYDYDFSVMDKYLALAEKNLGPLKIVIFPAWEAYMMQKESFQGRAYHKGFMEKQGRFANNTGPVVTLLDRATDKTENVVLPSLGKPGSKEAWKPLFDQLRERLAKRGLDKKMMVGMMNDGCPSKEDIAFFAEVAPDIPWVVAAHGTYTKANFGYRAVVYCKTAREKSLRGWKRPDLVAYFNRDRWLENLEPANWRTTPGFAIVGVWRGVGHIGGDFWKVLKDKKGRIVGRVYERYPQSNWRNLDIYTALLAPTETGPVITTRYEHLREGVQECEARVVVERAVTDEALRAKLGPELAARCEKALMEHMRALQMLRAWPGWGIIHCLHSGTDLGASWFLSSGWEKRAENLFTLAGEVERKTGKSVKP